MKARRLEAQTGFKPIHIELTLETVREARLFWHICNRDDLKKIILGEMKDYIEDVEDRINDEIFDLIDEAIKEQNIQIEK